MSQSYVKALEAYVRALEIGYNTGDVPENIVEITEAVTLAKDSPVNHAVTQLIEKCHAMNATQIAELENKFRCMELTELAGIVREQGHANAGEDYIWEYQAVVARKY